MAGSKSFLLVLTLAIVLSLVGCTDTAPVTVDPKDRDFLDFGKLHSVKNYSPVDFTNPHQVAAHAVWKCSQGETEALLIEMPHVEKDQGLGRAFVTFLQSFGPDLEQFRDNTLSLKFTGYALNEDTSVWYYYLATSDGKYLEHSPWVSAHRSRTTQRCALTGIFLYDLDTGEPGNMPDDLVRSLETK